MNKINFATRTMIMTFACLVGAHWGLEKGNEEVDRGLAKLVMPIQTNKNFEDSYKYNPNPSTHTHEYSLQQSSY